MTLTVVSCLCWVCVEKTVVLGLESAEQIVDEICGGSPTSAARESTRDVATCGFTEID